MFWVSLQVVVLQLNGIDQPKESVHVLNVGRLRMRLCKGKAVVAKEFYSSSMQVGCSNSRLFSLLDRQYLQTNNSAPYSSSCSDIIYVFTSSFSRFTATFFVTSSSVGISIHHLLCLLTLSVVWSVGIGVTVVCLSQHSCCVSVMWCSRGWRSSLASNVLAASK
jgi:hypothetical protein